jgi:hypothetical protein
MGPSRKPKVLIAATPIYEHVMPLRAVARELIARGYDVTFLTGSEYKQRIESIGATFVFLAGDADLDEQRIEEFHELSKRDPPLSKDEVGKRAFIDVIPSQHCGIQDGLKIIQEKAPDTKSLSSSRAPSWESCLVFLERLESDQQGILAWESYLCSYPASILSPYRV